MFSKIFKKLKDNGLEALGQAVTGNPIGAIGTLIGKPEIKEDELLEHLNRAEVIKILKEHDYLMAKLEYDDKLAYIEAYAKRDEMLVEKMKLNNENTSDARKMGIKTGMKFQNKFAVISTVALLVFLVYVITLLVFEDISEGVTAILNTLIGLILGIIGSIFNFYYGSKDDGNDLVEHKRIDSK